MNDSKVTIESLDTVRNFIVSISVENLSQFRLKYLSSFVNVEVELESVEVSCCNKNFYLPVLEHFIVILVTKGN